MEPTDHEFDPLKANLPRRRKPIPRWQQGPRPLIYGALWDRCTPEERRQLFVADLLTGAGFLGFVYVINWIAGS